MSRVACVPPMNTRRSFVCASLLTIASCVVAEEPENVAVEQPIVVDLCSVISNPLAYEHKLLRVTGDVSRGFEEFTLGRGSCGESTPLWLEYGGASPAEVIFCCVGEQAYPPNGKDPLWVEGIRTILIADQKFVQFDKWTKRLKRGKKVKSTLIGRLFAAGSYVDESGETVEIGYGHFGMSSLFVIQQVVAVKK